MRAWRHPRWIALWTVLATVPVSTEAASAEPVERPQALEVKQALERAHLCVADLDYLCAERELATARETVEAAAGDLRIEVLRVSAEVALATDRQTDAEAWLDGVLRLDPGYAPPAGAWPTAWREVLERARARLPDTQPPTVEGHLPTNVAAGAPLRVDAVVHDDRSGVAAVTLVVEGRDGEPLRFAMTAGEQGRWHATVPAELVSGSELALWIVATDRAGNGPASWGGPDAPRRVPIRAAAPPPAEEESLLEAWWLWTLVGVGVAGLGVGIYFLATPPTASERSPAGAARLDVGVQWPTR